MYNLTKFVKTYQADIILALAVILISITAFNLGKISVSNQQKAQLTITEQNVTNTSIPTNNNFEKRAKLNADTYVIASKNSTAKVYHFPWCASGSKISEKNKITFANETEAISAGYTLASNCQK